MCSVVLTLFSYLLSLSVVIGSNPCLAELIFCSFRITVAKHTVSGEEAEGVASIGVAVETLKVAEYLTPLLQEQLK